MECLARRVNDVAGSGELLESGAVDVLGQLDPHEQPAIGPTPVHARRCAELALQRIQENVALVLDGEPTLLDVLPEMVLEVLGRDHLGQSARSAVDLPGHESGGDGLGRDEEAQSDARAEDLRERADVHHSAWLGERVDRTVGQRFKADIAVSIVLDDRDVVLYRQLDQPLPTLERQGGAGRILIAGRRVDEGRPLADPILVLQHLGEGVHPHAMVVERYADELQAVLLVDADGPAILELFEDHAVAWPGEALRAQDQALHGAVGDHDVFDARADAMVMLEPLGGHGAELRHAQRVRVMRELFALA